MNVSVVLVFQIVLKLAHNKTSFSRLIDMACRDWDWSFHDVDFDVDFNIDDAEDELDDSDDDNNVFILKR